MICGGDSTRKFDAIFVNAPLKDYDREPRHNDFTLPVLGLGYIATYAAAKGHNVAVLDAEAGGMGPRSIAEALNKRKPRWVGFNLLAPTYQLARRVAEGLDQEILIMLGGHQAKAMPQDILNDTGFPRIDAMILGEGEYRCEAILRDISYRDSVPGVFYRKVDGSINKPAEMAATTGGRDWTAPDVDSLPFVDRTYFAQDPFTTSAGYIEANMVGSRGCPYDCSFCGAARSANPDIAIRTRSPDSLISELEFLNRRYSASAFRFVDDLFLAQPSYMKRCLPRFKEAGIGDRYMWDATGRINVLAKAGKELLLLMKQAGCREVALGIESGSERVLKYINKHITPQMTLEAVRRLTAEGINVKGYIIMGFPTETEEEVLATYHHVHELWRVTDDHPGSFRCSVFEFRPYPGTPEWHRLLASQKYTKDDLLSYDHIDLTDGGLEQALLDRDEFNFSVNIQFGQASLSQIRELLTDLTCTQKLRWNPNVAPS